MGLDRLGIVCYFNIFVKGISLICKPPKDMEIHYHEKTVSGADCYCHDVLWFWVRKKCPSKSRASKSVSGLEECNLQI